MASATTDEEAPELSASITLASSSGLPSRRNLLKWVKDQVKTLVSPPPVNFGSSFEDGMVLCALISKYCPAILKFSTRDKRNGKSNVKFALKVALIELDVDASLSGEHFENKPIDEAAVINYVGLLYLRMQQPAPKAKKSKEEREKRLMEVRDTIVANGEAKSVSLPQSESQTDQSSSQEKSGSLTPRGTRSAARRAASPRRMSVGGRLAANKGKPEAQETDAAAIARRKATERIRARGQRTAPLSNASPSTGSATTATAADSQHAFGVTSKSRIRGKSPARNGSLRKSAAASNSEAKRSKATTGGESSDKADDTVAVDTGSRDPPPPPIRDDMSELSDMSDDRGLGHWAPGNERNMPDSPPAGPPDAPSGYDLSAPGIKQYILDSLSQPTQWDKSTPDLDLFANGSAPNSAPSTPGGNLSRHGSGSQIFRFERPESKSTANSEPPSPPPMPPPGPPPASQSRTQSSSNLKAQRSKSPARSAHTHRSRSTANIKK